MTVPAATRSEDAMVAGVLRRVAGERDGFLLDCPSGALHPRNLPFTWAGGSLLFGWRPVRTIDVTADTLSAEAEGRGPAAHMAGIVPAPLAELFQQVSDGEYAIAVGFLSYDLGGLIEPTAASRHRSDGTPLARFAAYERFYEYDPARTNLFVNDLDGRRLAGDAELRRFLDPPPAAKAARRLRTGRLRSDFTRDAYMSAVTAARDYIVAGDIFEVNLSQRFTAAAPQSPGDLYMRLRSHNPAPYAAFLESPFGTVLSSSPELFLRVKGRNVITRPIKGTIAREAVAGRDDQAASRLAVSEKDNAELAMVIDLERNDLGRVSTYGSVRVAERARVETFARVHHLVSTVEGRLRDGVDLGALLGAAFPGGSITGAPKVRAMQIIDELEPCARGVYTGSLGYVMPGGRAELNIAIRTMIYRGGEVSFHVGGAVTADSVPQSEYDETLAKAAGMMAALGIDVADT